jgi:hypothetical protein
MKFVCKGIYKSEEQLAKAALPPLAVPYREPKGLMELNLAAIIMLIPLTLVLGLYLLLFRLVQGSILPTGGWQTYLIGLLLALLCIVPHEIIHAFCFPKGAEVEFWVAPQYLTAFVYSPVPMSKRRFLLLSFAPMTVLGLVPLSVWAVVPLPIHIACSMFVFGTFSLIFGSGDLVNVWNTIRRVPQGATVQLSGFHSYWHLPSD